MILAYYYILSSLPMLRKEGPPPITSDYFLHSCAEMIPEKTVGRLSSLKLLPEKGTGFGLLLTKDFIETNKGSISVVSELEKGTSFKFTLPKKTTKKGNKNLYS